MQLEVWLCKFRRWLWRVSGSRSVPSLLSISLVKGVNNEIEEGGGALYRFLSSSFFSFPSRLHSPTHLALSLACTHYSLHLFLLLVTFFMSHWVLHLLPAVYCGLLLRLHHLNVFPFAFEENTIIAVAYTDSLWQYPFLLYPLIIISKEVSTYYLILTFSHSKFLFFQAHINSQLLAQMMAPNVSLEQHRICWGQCSITPKI